jgi:hypothetical protein
MRYLKLFENFNSRDLVQNVEDMCLDLKDEYINTDVVYHDDNSLEISIGSQQVVLWISMSEFISRVVSYLKSEDWILSSMFIDNDEVIYPEKTIENLDKNPENSLSSVVLIFLEKEKSEEVIKSREQMMKQFTDAAKWRFVYRTRSKRNLMRSKKGFK